MPSRDEINWRPGRIQSINGEQEVILKQVWAYTLKFWGYRLAFSDSDLQYAQCFIPSTLTSQFDPADTASPINSAYLSRTATRGSIGSSNSHKTGSSSASKMRKGLFGGSKQPAATTGGSLHTQAALASAPADLERMHQIQTQSSLERYSPVSSPSDAVRNVFANYYKQSFEHAADFSDVDDDDFSDNASMDSFVTASTTITYPGEIFPDPPSKLRIKVFGKQNRAPAKSSSLVQRAKLVAVTPVHPNKNVLSVFSQYDPHKLHESFIGSTKNDAIDNFVLRFVRARKWNPANALTMITKSLNWRANEFPVNSWILEADGNSYINGKNPGFIKNLTTEKSWIAGHDRNKNPIFFFQARKHFGSDSPYAETQRYTIVTIEWVRLFLRDSTESVDQSSIVFDMTGFSLKNADTHTIKFLADCFEAHYPECLGLILIHNAPWIFSTVWNMIKNWLDPVVASKIHFTKDYKELCAFVEPKFIPADIGGEAGDDLAYIAPLRSDVRPPKAKDSTYHQLKLERDELFMRFIETTIKWIEAKSPSVSDHYLQDKIDLNTQLSDNYIALDKYIRCRGVYDRNHALVVRN